MKNKNTKALKYSEIDFRDIKKIVKIKKKKNHSKFDKWFNFEYKISEAENNLFRELISENEIYLSGYNEAKLAFRFISPLLRSVKFNFDDVQDWYESYLSGEVNGFKFNGKTDFMVAKGDFYPEEPYFFIQEFKRTTSTRNPEFQLLAELLVAVEINKTNIMQGCFIIGEVWKFLILEKLKTGNYNYFVSDSFNCLKIGDLRKIYTNLQAAKALFCKSKT